MMSQFNLKADSTFIKIKIMRSEQSRGRPAISFVEESRPLEIVSSFTFYR